MDRGAYQATVHGITRVRQDLLTKPLRNFHLLQKIKEKAEQNKTLPLEIYHFNPLISSSLIAFTFPYSPICHIMCLEH